MKALKSTAAVLLLSWSSFASAYTCICDPSPLIPWLSQMLSELRMIRANTNQIHVDLAGSGNVIDQLQQIQSETNQNRAALLQQTKQDELLSQYEVYETTNTAIQQAAALSDAESAKATLGSQHPGACSIAENAESVGRGQYVQAHATRAMALRTRANANRTANPANETARILELQDRDRVPEFIGSDAGTLNSDQVESYMSALSVLMPTPPRNPTALPDAYKGTPLAKEYEATFRKLESSQLFFSKPFLREATLMYPSIEMTTEIGRIWDQISSGTQVEEQLAATADGVNSTFPDHWSSLVPVDRGGRKYISERDFLRYEVFKRYANPYYQSDSKYGLASMGTTESLLKELITVANLQSRMMYEIMNSDIHTKQLLASIGSERVDDEYKAKLADIEARLTQN